MMACSSYFDDLSPETEEDKEAMFFEQTSLNVIFSDNLFKQWDEGSKEKMKAYLKNRLATVKNEDLLLRYGLHYFSLTKDFKSLNDTIAIGVNILRRIVTKMKTLLKYYIYKMGIKFSTLSQQRLLIFKIWSISSKMLFMPIVQCSDM